MTILYRMANGWKTFGIIVIALAVLSLVACGFCGILGSSSDEPTGDVNQGSNTPVINDKEEIPTVKPTESNTPTSTATFGEEQALKKAKSYLRSSAFSYEGLIDQLEYEEFTPEEAKYGVDNCGADWYEQAVKKAESYLRHMSFSYSELVDQLEFEGFTSDQAQHGASQAYN